jgi:hypothetical protein
MMLSAVIHRRVVLAAMLAAVAAVATDGAYLALIYSQNATGPNPGIVPFIAVYIAAIAASAVVAAALMVRGQITAPWSVLVSATTASAALGFLGIFSIGIALLVAAGLLGAAAVSLERTTRPATRLPAILGSVTAIAILIAGFTLSGVFFGS